MGNRNLKILPLNRVEGDLEIQVEISDGVVSKARCAGIMYRGFENIMLGRAPLDGLVITPRICGICSTSHLYAAAKALDMIYGASVPRPPTHSQHRPDDRTDPERRAPYLSFVCAGFLQPGLPPAPPFTRRLWVVMRP